MADRRAFCGLLVCLLLSGMSGLIYEVAWIRSLELVFGATTFAVATVLASFMGGLAAGSAAAGALEPRLRRFHPLRLYALCEAGIAAVAIVVPLVFRALVPLSRLLWGTFHGSFAAFSLLRFVLCAAVLLVPTALMGATLPILSRFVAGLGEADAARRVGCLFTINTAGAVVGCAFAGLVLLPSFGLVATPWIAAGLNLAAAAIALLLARRSSASDFAASDVAGSDAAVSSGPPAGSAPTAAGTSSTGTTPAAGAVALVPRAGLIVAAYALSGAVAMLYEVAWNRALVLVLGSSTYSYTTMLTTFLVGLTLGAWLGTRLLRTPADPLLAIGLCQLLTAVTTALGLFTAGELPYFYVRLATALNPSPRGLLLVQVILAAAVMFPPTLGLGAMFPLTVSALGLSRQSGAQRLVARAYAWNTVGAISGALLAGFWLLPLLGSRNLLLAGVGVNALLAITGIGLARQSDLKPAWRTTLMALIVLFLGDLAFAAPAWRADILSSGVFRYVDRYRDLDRAGFRQRVRESHGEVLFFEEGLTCTIGVFRTTRSLTLLNNGKPDASVPPGLGGPVPAGAKEPLGDLPTQVLVGQLPLLLAPRIDDVMVVGLGSGVTLGSVLRQDVRHVDSLELEAAVVHASRFFDRYSGGPLKDPRVNMVVNDARNDLLVGNRLYDVIISEPSNPWIPGAASLFTRDFFRIARRRLRPDGVLCQWMQLYELEPEDFRTILRSFMDVFPRVQIWRVGVDAIMIGGPSDLPLPVARIFERASPSVRADLARIGIHGPEDLLAHFWIGGDELRGAVPPGPINTDDNMRIEFAAPLRMLARDRARLTRQEIELKGMFHDRTTGALPLLQFPEDDAGKRARFLTGLAQATLLQGFTDEAAVYGAAAWQAHPEPVTAAVRAETLTAAGRESEAAAARDEAERAWPRDPVVRRMLLAAAVGSGDRDAIRRHAEALVAIAPDDNDARFELARTLEASGNEALALRTLEPMLTLLPSAPPPAAAVAAPSPGDALPEGAARLLGILLVDARRGAEAEPVLRAHLAAHPDDREALVALARAERQAGREALAVAIERRLAPDASDQASVRLAIAQAAFDAGRYDAARAPLEEALQYAPSHEGAALLLARTLRRLGERRQAATLLNLWLTSHPDRPPAVGLLSQLLSEAGDKRSAAAAAARYRALTGEDWSAIDADPAS
jgi:spermidine synthase